MLSERIRRRIEALLDEADSAVVAGAWDAVDEKARAVLAIEPTNEDALAFLAMAEGVAARPRSVSTDLRLRKSTDATEIHEEPSPAPAEPLPADFGGGRYRVLRLLGEGGRKRVYLAHDTRLARDVAFALVRGAGLDNTGRERVTREAQSMARLGSHPNLVTLHDIGEEDGDLFLVQEYIDGGDVAGLIASQAATASRIDLARITGIARDVLRGLDHLHRAGVIHRDLKPANVFLAGGGTAKVGDFGLAMTADLSRLTQHGTFLGTVAYMPPEQAVGGEVDARSDLYSFGCLLYEVLTGQPPFAGGDPMSVISQHLNTPPVSPSWHREDCPPALEQLTLKLLEKDPAKRPVDAQEALRLLEGINLDERPVPRSERPALDRLARGVFVGREGELARLKKAFDDALGGHGGLVMLVGEPGIGKTRTSGELETYARMRGARVLWGRSHENSGAPAFLPWIHVGRQWAAGLEPDRVASFLGTGGWELVRLFPDMRSLPGFVEPVPPPDPNGAQFRLFDAYSSFVRAVSEQTPLVIALDDVHWADRPTLQLLEQLARDLARMRVLVICTYRDTELARTHPLSEALANLGRDPGFERIVLRGLSANEVDAYIAASAGFQPSKDLVDRVFEETEGNPFFLSEVVNLLAQEGTLGRQSVSDLRIPDGVREALGRRLDRLSDDTNELLKVAAVAGREFNYETLHLLSSGGEEALLRSVEEGIAARVIEEMDRPGAYRFTHALMQETLLGELTTTRRVRLHGMVAEALERRWGERATQNATRLANHYAESATLTPAHAAKAMHYLGLAAEQAEARFAWAEAARLYERCLGLSEGLSEGALAAEVCRRLESAGRCYRLSGEFRPAWRSLMRAITGYREAGDGLGAARATSELLRMQVAPERTISLADAALADLDGAGPAVECDLLIAVMHAGLPARAREAAGRARTIARAHGLTIQEAIVDRCRSLWLATEGRFAEADEVGSRAIATLTAAGNWDYGGPVLPYSVLASGGLDAFRRNMEDVTAHHARTGNRLLRDAGLGGLVAAALARGDDAEATRLAAEVSPATFWVDLLRARSLEIRGRAAEALALVPRKELAAGVPYLQTWLIGTAARLALHADRREEAESLYSEWRAASQANRGILPGPVFYSPVEEFGWIDEALPVLAGNDDLRADYACLVEHGAWKACWSCVSCDRLRGELARALGLLDEAEHWYGLGLEWAEAQRIPLERGRCLQGLAAVAEARGDLPGALALLDQAAAPLRERGATFYLDQVVAKKLELLGLSGADSTTSILGVSAAIGVERPDLSRDTAPDGSVTLMFTDIEGSTALNLQLGDARWVELLRDHNAVVEAVVRAHGGRVVKNRGDGYMAAFRSTLDGIACALAIQKSFEEGATEQEPGGDASASRGIASPRIRVRIGLHAGNPVAEGDDFFGADVNLAARVADSAAGGEVLVSDALRSKAAGSFAFDAGREAALRGFEGQHRVFAVVSVA